MLSWRAVGKDSRVCRGDLLAVSMGVPCSNSLSLVYTWHSLLKEMCNGIYSLAQVLQGGVRLGGSACSVCSHGTQVLFSKFKQLLKYKHNYDCIHTLSFMISDA